MKITVSQERRLNKVYYKKTASYDGDVSFQEAKDFLTAALTASASRSIAQEPQAISSPNGDSGFWQEWQI